MWWHMLPIIPILGRLRLRQGDQEVEGRMDLLFKQANEMAQVKVLTGQT